MRAQYLAGPSRNHPAIETIEARRLLSSSLSGGVLTLTGTGAANTFDLQLINNGQQIRVNEIGQKSINYPAPQVQKIKADLMGGDDKLTISAAIALPATVAGGSGNDSITTGNGNDSISGGSGKDTLVGLSGKDTINGDDGNDNIFGGQGNDLIHGGAGDDSMFGNGGNDFIAGDTGNGGDEYTGGAGNDTLLSSDGSPSMNGGDGNDLLIGGPLEDAMNGGLGKDTMDGGGGTNSVLYVDRTVSVTVVINLDGSASTGNGQAGEGDRILNIGEVQGGSGNDTLTIKHGSKTHGAFLAGNGGNDTLTGDVGPDSFFGAAGNDSILGNGGNDSIEAGTGNDRVDAGSGNDTVLGDDGNDTLLGGSGNDRLFGDDGADSLVGGSGDDFLNDAGDGAGRLVSPAFFFPKDTLDGGTGTDIATFDKSVSNPLFHPADKVVNCEILHPM